MAKAKRKSDVTGGNQSEQSQGESGRYKLAKKVSLGNVYGKPSFADGESEKDAMIVYGYVAKMEVDEGDKGSFVRFKGDFVGVNLETGGKYRAGTMYLPGTAESTLAAAVDMAGGGVRFAFRITARKAEDSITGYVWDVESLMANEESDPMNEIAQQVLPTNLLEAK